MLTGTKPTQHISKLTGFKEANIIIVTLLYDFNTIVTVTA